MTAMHPAAYLRRSFVDDNSPGDISREAQRDAVRRLAAADGHNGELVEYDDWGVSADVRKSAKRTAYARLLADMESGRVSAVYAFDADRLFRDPRDLIRLQDAAQTHRVRIVTTAGPLAIGDGDDPSAEGFAFISAVFGRMELQKAKKRAGASLAARKKRGDALGRPGFGYKRVRDDSGRIVDIRDPEQDVEPVLAAYADAGSFHRAAVLLNAQGVPSPRGGVWSGNVVGRIVRRERPGLAPRARATARAASRGSQRLSRLLRCPCGQLMTPRVQEHEWRDGRRSEYVAYQCHRARYDPHHARPYMVTETAVLPWAQAEAARLRLPSSQYRRAERDAKRRAELEAQRKLIGAALLDGLLDGLLDREQVAAQAAERAAAIDAEIDQLDDREAVSDAPSVEWESGTPSEINAVLRTLWRSIELGPDLRPLRAEWRLPELRQA